MRQSVPEIHTAIQYFQLQHRKKPSQQLVRFLSRFNEPKLMSSEHFAEGVKRFIELANTDSVEREAIYEDFSGGLHYNNDLVKLWNENKPSELKASQIMTLVPAGWDALFQDGVKTLIYKGQQPAQALDDLVKGPTVIDCGMFTQLSLWFGIRYILGNERFNQCFGRAPFFITQLVYNGIKECNKPFSGNPLYSFLAPKGMASVSSVTVKHLANTPLYPLKHPGGNYGGENCIVIGDQYYIFDPQLKGTQGITETAVLNLLRDAFNEPRKPYDAERLSLYAATPDAFHPKLLQTYGQLIEAALKLRDTTLSEAEFSCVMQSPQFELTFDLNQFSTWLLQIEKPMVDPTDYVHQAIDDSHMPSELLAVIPFENRTSMDFSKFREESLQQKELMMMSKQFCQSIMAAESKLVILTGKAGVGKTASAVCAAKELTARGKKVVWISEVMVKGWSEQAQSFADLANCEQEIDKLLASDPHAVFLDDDNLASFSGNLLLEKIYSWFVSNPGKGLFITSNEPIGFGDCYGYKLDRKYYYPPFNDYFSPQYLNWLHKEGLAGISLRSKRDGQSIGAVVSDASWKTHQARLGEVELIPGFDDNEELAPIRQSLRETGLLACDAYNQLRPIQKQWIKLFQVKGHYMMSPSGESSYIKPFLNVMPLQFEKTTCKTIALEIKEYNHFLCGKTIDDSSMRQLISVLNYAHDQGGRRVILINQTSYSPEALRSQIQAQLPKAESERTWARLQVLLCESEDSVFSLDEFNGHIETGHPVKPLPEKCSHGVNSELPSRYGFDSKASAHLRESWPKTVLFESQRMQLLLSKIEDSVFSLDEFNGHIETGHPVKPLPEKSSHGFNSLLPFRDEFQLRPYDKQPIRIPRALLRDGLDNMTLHVSTPWTFDTGNKLFTHGTFLLDSKIASVLNKAKARLNLLDALAPSPTKASVNQSRFFSGGMPTKQLCIDEKAFLIENRHDNAKLQHEYDKRFGLILK